MKIIETERLLLRDLKKTDAEFIFELVNEPDWLKNIGDKNVKNIADAENYILNVAIASYEKNGFGLYAVELKATGEAIGICGLVRRDFLEDPDIGFAFLERFRLKGFASESARAVIDQAKKQFEFKRLAAITVPDNSGSIRVLEKIGFSFEKMMHKPGDKNRLMYFSAEI